MSEKVFEEKNSRLKVKNSKNFLKLLQAGTDDKAYNALLTYGKKILNKKVKDIPIDDQLIIINYAIAKTNSSYDPNQNTNVLTYFTSKLWGEISHYNLKKTTLIKKMKKLYDNTKGDMEVVYSKETGQNTLEHTDKESTEDKLLKEDIYFRQMQAFRMAMATLPLEYQRLLKELMNSSIKEIAAIQGKMTTEIAKERNYAVSLILQKVLRSNHLDEEEKEELKQEHGLI